MTAPKSDSAFAGSIPQLYERYLVPLIFEPYAIDLAARVAALSPSRVLEIAAGTGVVTRRLAATLPPSATIDASGGSPAASARVTAPVPAAISRIRDTRRPRSRAVKSAA